MGSQHLFGCASVKSKGGWIMCGLAGLIHRGKSTNVGLEMQNMLQSLKHRGPDSTGYALYGDGNSNNYILRFKVGENVKEGSSAIPHII